MVKKKAVNSVNLAPFLIVIFSVLLYNIGWDIISMDRILSLNAVLGATVFDLGDTYIRIWQVFFQPSYSTLLYNLARSPVIFLFAPYLLVRNSFVLVGLQTLWISLTAIPLYFISFSKLGRRLPSVFISISYLLFFGIAGMNWFDVHFQTLFPLLFVTGYAMKLSNRNRLSALFFISSGLTNIAYMIFPIIFLVYVVYDRHKNKVQHGLDSWNLALLVSWVYFVVGFTYIFLVSAHSGGNPLNFNTSSHSLLSNVFSDIDMKIFTALILLSPFLFLPLLSKRWFIYPFIYIGLMFFANDPNYIFPLAIRFMYFSSIVPFLFLGTIDTISNLHINNNEPNETHKRTIFVLRKHVRFDTKIVLLIFILIVLLGTTFEPYGPLNSYSSANFQTSDIIHPNIKMYENYIKMVNLIPTNTPYVLYQNNMPQLLFRDPYAFSDNFGISNNFSFYIDGKWTSNISYIIADPYSSWFSQYMYNDVYHYISTGKYGLLGEYEGIILLEKNYYGSPKVYSPLDINLSASDISLFAAHREGNEIISNNLTNGEVGWYGSAQFLQPGQYSISINIMSKVLNSSNKFQLLVSSQTYNGSRTIGLFNVSERSIQMVPGVWQNVTFNAYVNNFYDNVQFIGQNFDWSGNLSLREISIVQKSYLL